MNEWITSSFCNLGGCAEVMYGETSVVVRDSKDPDGPVLVFTTQEWRDFTAGVRAGEFDVPPEHAPQNRLAPNGPTHP